MKKDRLVLLFIGALLLVVFFLYGNFRGDSKDEEGLRARYQELVKLDRAQNCDAIYNSFLSPTEKAKTSHDDFIEECTKHHKEIKIAKDEIIIHSVTIRGDEGYIYRTRTICLDNNCIDKKSESVYKKWIYLGNHWYYALKTPLCIRTRPYDKSPELERAISLVFQRFMQSYGKDVRDFSNCIDVSYSNLESEGVFVFDKNISSPERLVIKVDYSYRDYDDLLIASLLAHEIMHASQFLDYLHDGKSKSCTEQEVEAFFSQVRFISILNSEEMSSLINRFYYNYTKNPALQGVEQLFYIVAYAGRDCNKETTCWINEVHSKIEEMVKSNPVYQEQCNLK